MLSERVLFSAEATHAPSLPLSARPWFRNVINHLQMICARSLDLIRGSLIASADTTGRKIEELSHDDKDEFESRKAGREP